MGPVSEHIASFLFSKSSVWYTVTILRRLERSEKRKEDSWGVDGVEELVSKAGHISQEEF